jgi:RNA polymerase sigma factor (sigma-70 family)
MSSFADVHQESLTHTGSSPDQPNWADLVDRIQREDTSALEELYRIFSKGMRYYLCRQLGPQDLDDKVHDCFLIVILAIRRGELRDPERLMGFARTIVRRQIAGHIDVAVQQRKQQVDLDVGAPLPDSHLSPEAAAMTKEEEHLAVSVLKGISRRDREILTRFYLDEQTQEQICREMKLSETQFRLLKSRAKARFGELGRRRMSRRNFKVF